MLATITPDLRWSRLQEPAHPSTPSHADTLRLLSALDQGWKIVETVHITPFNHGDVDAYMVTLFHPARQMLNSLTLDASPEIKNLLRNEAVITVNRHTSLVE